MRMPRVPKVKAMKKPPVIRTATKPRLRTRKLSIAGKSDYSGAPAFAPPSTPAAPQPAFPSSGPYDAAPGTLKD